MDQSTRSEVLATLSATNIGGIEGATVTFEPGVTVLAGRNATNKTSLLQSIMAALGSTNVSLKSDADSGSVTLQIDDEEYTRSLTRRNGTVVFDGDPYLEDTALADLFAFLLPSNEARRTVELGGDLRNVIMEPVDTDTIQAEIARLERTKSELDEQINRKQELETKRTELERQQTEIETDIERKQEVLAAKQEELADADTDNARSTESELETKMEELQQLQSTLEDVTFRLENQKESLSSLREERTELEKTRRELDGEPDEDIDSLEAEISRLRNRKQQLDSELHELQSVIQFNEEMIETENMELRSALDETEESVTDDLLEADTTVCWTCGTKVPDDRIGSTLDALREFRKQKYTDKEEIVEELEQCKDRKSTLEARQQRWEEIRQKLSEIDGEIERREKKVEQLESEREEVREELEQVETEVEELEREDNSEILSLQSEVNRLELELERLEDDCDQLQEQIEDVEDQLSEVETLTRRRADVVDQLNDLRTRVDRIETSAVEEFNHHMENILDILEYDNIDRIWLDRVEEQTRRGREKVTETAFRLHVVRRNDEGVAYEDEFAHLSESEREVTALVFALAGYLVHEVHETVPFILLDSLEAIDAQRIDALLGYLMEYVEYLVVALLPEDAAEITTEHRRITEL